MRCPVRSHWGYGTIYADQKVRSYNRRWDGISANGVLDHKLRDTGLDIGHCETQRELLQEEFDGDNQLKQVTRHIFGRLRKRLRTLGQGQCFLVQGSSA